MIETMRARALLLAVDPRVRLALWVLLIGLAAARCDDFSTYPKG